MTLTVFEYLMLISIDFSAQFRFRFRSLDWEDLSNTAWGQCFANINTPLRLLFSTLFSVFGTWSNTVFRAWYITWISANFKGIKLCVERPRPCTIVCFAADKLCVHCVSEMFLFSWSNRVNSESLYTSCHAYLFLTRMVSFLLTDRTRFWAVRNPS